MKRLLILFLILLLPAKGMALTVIDSDFNDMSWGPLSHDSGWTMQATGGVDDTPALRLTYSSLGTSPHEMHLDVSAASSQAFWVEADVKITGTMNGGMKFIKFFGSATQESKNNMTLICDYSAQTQNRVVYNMDTLCETYYTGSSQGSCGFTPVVTNGAIDLRGGTWGHYKAYLKRADPGASNGELQVWWNGVEKVHLTNMASNPSGSATDAFAYISFGDYTNSNTSTWYFWLDNLYVGTVEKGASTPTYTCYPDADGDGYGAVGGTPESGVTACSADYYTASQLGGNIDNDCNDGASDIHLGATEICGDGIDQDCNGSDLACAPPPPAPGTPGALIWGGSGRARIGGIGRIIVAH